MEDNEFNSRAQKLLTSLILQESVEDDPAIWMATLSQIMIDLITSQPQPEICMDLVIERIKEEINVKKTT